jgi:hypothetical protein
MHLISDHSEVAVRRTCAKPAACLQRGKSPPPAPGFLGSLELELIRTSVFGPRITYIIIGTRPGITTLNPGARRGPAVA